MTEFADALVDAVGFIAGLLVSVALVPQIYRAHKRKSARDLSYSWQIILALGVSFQLVYLFHNDLWAAFVPLTGELILILYLTGLKMYYQEEKIQILPEGALGPGDGGYVADGSKREGEQGQIRSADHIARVAGSEGEVNPEGGANSGQDAAIV